MVLALAALCMGSSAHAEDETVATETAEDEDIEVMRIVAFDTTTRPEDVTSAGEAIDLTRYLGEGKRLEEILSQSVGVQIRRFGGAGERAEVSIRGFSSAQTRVELDGIALNGGRSNGVDLASIPLSQLESVEVIRGGSAVLGGSGAMGGVVALRTRRPDFPSGQINVHAGSFGTVETAIHGTKPGEHVDVGFGYAGFRTQGDYEFARVETVYPGDVTLPPSASSAERINNDRERHDGHLSLGVDFGHRGYLLAQQLVGYQTGGEPGLDREAASETAGQQRFAEQDWFRSVSQLRLESFEIPGPMGELEASLAHRYERSEFRDDDPALADWAIDDDFVDHATTLALEPRWEVIGPFADHVLRSELQLQREAFDVTDARARDRYTVGIKLSDHVSFLGGKLLVSPGLRFDWNDATGTHWLPVIGVVVSPRPWLRLRGNVSRAFRNPAFQDLYLPDRGFSSGNPDLDPERAVNYEVGVELQIARFLLLSNVVIHSSVFRSEIENSIVWLRVSPYKIRPENSDDARTEGVEVGLAFDLGRFARVFANHTELRAETRPQGARLPGRAERETSVRLELGDDDGWKAAGEYQRTGSIPVSTGGAFTLPTREVWNASFAFDLVVAMRRFEVDPGLQRIWFGATVHNIGDAAVRDSLGFPQPGRTLRVGVEGTW
jgi:outer membrane receptor protein involved in Fe transport